MKYRERNKSKGEQNAGENIILLRNEDRDAYLNCSGARHVIHKGEFSEAAGSFVLSH